MARARRGERPVLCFASGRQVLGGERTRLLRLSRDLGDGVDRDEAERRRAVRRGSRRSEGGCFLTSATCPHARLCSPPTARARGHAAAAVLRLLKRPDYPRTPRPPRLPVARVAALALISIPRSSPLSSFFSQTRHGGSPRLLIRLTRPCPSLQRRASRQGEGPRSRASGGRPLRRCAVRAGILVDRILGGFACCRRA